MNIAVYHSINRPCAGFFIHLISLSVVVDIQLLKHTTAQALSNTTLPSSRYYLRWLSPDFFRIRMNWYNKDIHIFK